MSNTTNPPAGAGQTTPPQATPGQTPPTNPPGQTPPSGNTQQTPFDSLPADVQEYIKSLRKEAKTHREQLDAFNAQKQKDEEERLRQQGEYKALAEQREARVKELEPKVARLEALETQIREQIKKDTKDWPAEVKAFYPGDDADVSHLQTWYTNAKPILEKLNAQVRGGAPGNSPNPPPANAQARAKERDQANREDLSRRRSYPRFAR